MTFIALAVAYVCVCTVIGLRPQRGSDLRTAALLAGGVVVAQLVLLLLQ